MYCRNCGSRLPDEARFCGECGTPVAASQIPVISTPDPVAPTTKKKGFGSWLLMVIVLGLVVAGIITVTENADSGSSSGGKKSEPVSVTTAQTTPTVSQKPDNGWYEENGNRYYYYGGRPVTGLQDIGGKTYYFYHDGIMAANTNVDINGNTLEISSSGQITGMVLAGVNANWSQDYFSYGYNGRASILELEDVVENCDRTGFYIEAEGNYGASMTCNWKIHVRSHGNWVYAGEYYYTEPSGYFELRFDSPIDFDAVTAYPTVTGNASYSCYFAPVDIHIRLY